MLPAFKTELLPISNAPVATILPSFLKSPPLLVSASATHESVVPSDFKTWPAPQVGSADFANACTDGSVSEVIPASATQLSTPPTFVRTCPAAQLLTADFAHD